VGTAEKILKVRGQGHSEIKCTSCDGGLHFDGVTSRLTCEFYGIHLHYILHFTDKLKQDAQLSQRDRAAGCVIVFAKNRTLELEDNDLRTL